MKLPGELFLNLMTFSFPRLRNAFKWSSVSYFLQKMEDRKHFTVEGKFMSMRKPTAARKKRTFGRAFKRKSLRSTKWTFSFSFLLAAVDRLLPHELHFPCLFLDRSIVSVCPLQELFLSFRRTNSKLTMLRTVIKEKIENVSSRNAIIASSWIIFSNNFFKINFQSKWKKKRLKSWSEIIKWKDYEEAFIQRIDF